MTTTEQTIWATAGGVAALAAISAVVSFVLGAMTGDRPAWFDSDLPVVILAVAGGVIAAVLMAVILVAVLRRLDPIWANGGTISVDDRGTIILYTKKLFREPVEESTVQLDQVAMLTWYIDMFDPAGVEYLQFWDQDPELTMDIFGLMPQNRAASTLVEIPQRFLQSAPTTEARLRFELEQRIEQGTLLSNVDVQTWTPIGNKLPPLADGIRFEGRKVIREARREDEE